MVIKYFDFLCYIVNRLDITKADKRYIKKYYIRNGNDSGSENPETVVTNIRPIREMIDTHMTWCRDRNKGKSFWENIDEEFRKYYRENIDALEDVFNSQLIPCRKHPVPRVRENSIDDFPF